MFDYNKVKYEVLQSIGADEADDFDIDAIMDELHNMNVESIEDVDGDEYWGIIARNAVKKWQGEGWYTFQQLSDDGPRFAEAPEAVWVESEYDFDDFSAVDEGYECDVVFYGAGDLPDGDVRVAERFVATFTPEQAAAYNDRLGL